MHLFLPHSYADTPLGLSLRMSVDLLHESVEGCPVSASAPGTCGGLVLGAPAHDEAAGVALGWEDQASPRRIVGTYTFARTRGTCSRTRSHSDMSCGSSPACARRASCTLGSAPSLPRGQGRARGYLRRSPCNYAFAPCRSRSQKEQRSCTTHRSLCHKLGEEHGSIEGGESRRLRSVRGPRKREHGGLAQ